MLVLAAGEAFVLALLALLVAGLLRSHAEILRRLHALEADRPASGPVTEAALPFPVRRGVVAPRSGTGEGARVVDIAGVTPFDEAVSISVLNSRVDTLLAFLSSSCTTCSRLWETVETFGSGGAGLPDRTRLVVVTLGSGEESPARLRRLAPRSVPVVMSSEAWEDYRVPGAPYFILVDGSGGVVRGEGSAVSWADVASLVADASGDGHRRPGAAESDQAREARVDRELAAAGILPGDPRLYHQPVEREA